MHLDTLPALKGAAQEAPKEARASLEDEVLDGGPSNADRVVVEALLEIVAEISFSSRIANVGPSRLKGVTRMVLNSPVIPMKWEAAFDGCACFGSRYHLIDH